MAGGLPPHFYTGELSKAQAGVEAGGLFQEEGWKISVQTEVSPEAHPATAGYNSSFYLAEGFRVSFCLSVSPRVESQRQMFYPWAAPLPASAPLSRNIFKATRRLYVLL